MSMGGPEFLLVIVFMIASYLIWYGLLMLGMFWGFRDWRRGRRRRSVLLITAVFFVAFGPNIRGWIDYFDLRRAAQSFDLESSAPDLTDRNVVLMEEFDHDERIDSSFCKRLVKYSGANTVYIAEGFPEGESLQPVDVISRIRGKAVVKPYDRFPDIDHCELVPQPVTETPDYLILDRIHEPERELKGYAEHFSVFSAEERERLSLTWYFAPLTDAHSHVVSAENSDLLIFSIFAHRPPLVWFPGSDGSIDVFPTSIQKWRALHSIFCRYAEETCE